MISQLKRIQHTLLGSGLLLLTACSVTVTEQMIVSPSTEIDQANLTVLTDEAGYTESFIESANGAQLHTLSLKRDAAQPTILVLHGNALNLTLQPWFGLLHTLSDLDYNVVAIDYQGFGLSGGDASFSAMRDDAQAVINALPDASQIIVYGLSLGSVMALDISTDTRVTGLIIEGGVTTDSEMIEVFQARNTLGRFASVDVDERIAFNNTLAIETLDKPVLVIHGQDDRNIPVEMGQQLFHASNHSDSQLYVVEQGGHADTFHIDNEQFKLVIDEFISRIKEKK